MTFEWQIPIEERPLVIDKNKLKGFPSVYAISTVEAFDRRTRLINSFKEYNIDINIRVFSRNIDHEKFEYDESRINPNHKLTHDSVVVKIIISHLKSIKRWYDETSEPYAFFCEDDLSLETVPYWNFTWEEFVDELPSHWQCVQLSWLRQHPFAFGDKIRNRCWDDWSAAAYIMKREHAKKILECYYPNGTFKLDIHGWDVHLRDYWAKYPNAENLIFSDIGRLYSFMLFVDSCDIYIKKEENEFPIFLDNGALMNLPHIPSKNEIMKFWKTKGRFRTLSESKEWA